MPIAHIDTRALAAAAGCYATARNLVRYFAAHLPGDERLLSDRSKRIAQHPAWPLGSGDSDHWYGLVLRAEGR